MVILLILTILGVTAIGTSTLEEKMSGNVQEVTRAFQAAESGLNQALRSGTALDPNQTTQNTYTFDGGKSGTATVTTSFRQYGNLPRSQTPSGTGFTGAHFNMASEGKVTATGAKTVVNQGVAQTMRSLD